MFCIATTNLCDSQALIFFELSDSCDVEDNASNIELVEQILTSLRPGIKLFIDSGGNKVVTIAGEQQVDLILLDLNLPEIHGLEIMKLLKKEVKTRDIPVVIVSSDAMPNQIEQLLQAGARNYLTKPLDVINFLEVIDEFINE